MNAFLEKYGVAITIAGIVLLVLAFTGIGAIVGRLAMFGTLAMLVWLALRLLQYGNWHDKKYWEFNASIGLYTIVLFAITAFVIYFDPHMPNLGTGECRVSRYETC
jgi:hypothetical protein